MSMSNKLVGYMIAVPFVVGMVVLATTSYFPGLVAKVDLAIYVLIGIVFLAGFLIGLIKLWKLPNTPKQWLPISNRWIIFISLLAGTTQKITEELGVQSSQIETLVGMVAFILLITMTYRLIYTEVLGQETEKVLPD